MNCHPALVMTNQRTYKIGDVALSRDIDTSRTAEAESKVAAASFEVGDGAFIRRR